MNKYYKHFTIFAIFIIIIFSLKLYNEKYTSQHIKELSIKYEAESISNFLVSFRATYQDVFIKNHTKLDKSNIDFLPVRTTNEIAKIFSSLNSQVKITTVSSRPRNPINQADKRQLEVINQFEQNKNIKYLFNRVENKYYYSQPLYITQTCLKCHGKKENAPKIISQNYNKAYNYKLGELRGIIDIQLSQTRLSKFLDDGYNKRVIFVFIFLSMILIATFIYATYNKNLDEKMKINEEKTKEKDKIFLTQELKQKNYLDTIIESNDNAIIAIDKNRTILTYNKKAEEIFGFTKQEMIGSKNLLNIIPVKYKNLHTVASELYFKSGKSKGIIGSTLELEGINKDGIEFPIRISFGSSGNEDGRIVIANITNITKYKQQEKTLHQQSRLAQMGEMISMIAHQWRQPLSAISSSVISVESKLSLGKYNLEVNEDREKFLEFLNKKHTNISEYVKTLSETIDDFRNFFKPDKQKEVASLNSPIDKALKIVNTSMASKGIDITLDLTNQDKLPIYQNEVMQVVLNILKNSEDNFAEKSISDGKIFIKTYKFDIEHIIEISDNGGGIPKDIITNIFDPYFSTKDEKNGTGLGLYMSKIMIEDHHDGELIVSNTTDGVCFKIILRNSKNV